MKERVIHIDFLAGIMISFMMSYHALFPMLGNRILSVIPFLYFFMPWFFYKSGIFFSPTKRIVVSSLIKPFCVWSVIGFLIYIIYTLYVTKDASFGSMVKGPLYNLLFNAYLPINQALWFLPVLLLVKIISKYLLRSVKLEFTMLIFISAYAILQYVIIKSPYFPSWVNSVIWGGYFS